MVFCEMLVSRYDSQYLGIREWQSNHRLKIAKKRSLGSAICHTDICTGVMGHGQVLLEKYSAFRVGVDNSSCLYIFC